MYVHERGLTICLPLSVYPSSSLFVVKERDENRNVIPGHHILRNNDTAQSEFAHLYRRACGALKLSNAAAISIFAAPSAFRAKCVATFPSTFTNLFSAPQRL